MMKKMASWTQYVLTLGYQRQLQASFATVSSSGSRKVTSYSLRLISSNVGGNISILGLIDSDAKIEGLEIL